MNARSQQYLASKIRRHLTRRVMLPVPLLAAALTGDAALTLLDHLGAKVVTAVLDAAPDQGSREYQRLRAVGVSPYTAAVLAHYRREAGPT